MSRAAAWVAAGLLVGAAHAVATEPSTPIRVLAADALPAEAAGLLVSGRSGGALRFLPVIASRPTATRTAAGVDLWLEIEATSLLEGLDDEILHLEVFAYALGVDGGLALSLTEVVELRFIDRPPALLADGAAVAGIKLHADLPLAPGKYDLRLLLRARQTGVLGLHAHTLTIPGQDPGELLPPLIAEAGEAWLRVDLGDGAALHPAPAARAVRASEGELGVILRPSPAAAESLELLHDDRREEAPILAVEVEGSRTALPLGGLEDGVYALRRRRGDAVSATTPLVVFSGGLPAGATWAEMLRRSEAADRTPADGDLEDLPEDRSAPAGRRAARPEARLALPRSRITERIREALRLAASGEAKAAGEAIDRLDEEALGGSGAAVPTLVRFVAELHADLTAAQPEALLPILALHLERFRERSHSGRFLLASQARLLCRELLDLYVDRSSNPGAGRVAADFMVEVARVQMSEVDSAGQEALNAALAFDPTHAAALLALAAGRERRGDPTAAARLLEQLAQGSTGDGLSEEAALHLAVSQARSGRWRAARERLRRLAERAATPWIRRLAWQTLATHQVASGRLDEATRVIEQARSVFPEDEKLLLLAAFLLDRRGLANEARELLTAGLREGLRGAEPSASHRFSRPWGRPDESAGERFAAAAGERLAALDELLEESQ